MASMNGKPVAQPGSGGVHLHSAYNPGAGYAAASGNAAATAKHMKRPLPNTGRPRNAEQKLKQPKVKPGIGAKPYKPNYGKAPAHPQETPQQVRTLKGMGVPAYGENAL
jgi:hypothetical protein